MGDIRLIINEEEIDTDGYVPLIRHQHKVLCRYRDDGRTPSQHLLEDIAVYEFILGHDNPERAAQSYMSKRSESGFGEKKINIAKQLGWEITVNGGDRE